MLWAVLARTRACLSDVNPLPTPWRSRLLTKGIGIQEVKWRDIQDQFASYVVVKG